MKNVLVYTVHKAASMFLHKLVMELSKQLEFDVYSINDKKYHDAIKQSSWQSFIANTMGSACFGPIRTRTAIKSPTGLSPPCEVDPDIWTGC